MLSSVTAVGDFITQVTTMNTAKIRSSWLKRILLPYFSYQILDLIQKEYSNWDYIWLQMKELNYPSLTTCFFSCNTEVWK